MIGFIEHFMTASLVELQINLFAACLQELLFKPYDAFSLFANGI